MINQVLDFDDVVDTAETTDITEKGPSARQLARIERSYQDILNDDVSIEVEMAAQDKEVVSRIWRYIESARKQKSLERDVVKITSGEYVEAEEKETDDSERFGRYQFEEERESLFDDRMFD